MPTFNAILNPDRQHIRGLSDKTYFNYGGQGQLPQVAYKAIIQTYERLEQDGPFSIAANQEIQTITEQLRGALAAQYNVAADTITLTENVTAGCNIVLWGIDWQADDEILLTDCEHPGVVAIVQAIAARFGVKYRFCSILDLSPGETLPERIQQNLTPQTRLVVLSHLLWNTGAVLPLSDIMVVCREYPSHKPIRVLVDAAQSAGSLPSDFSTCPVDFYAFTGHKWFCGPAGVGGLYIHPDCLAEVTPTYTGWRGIQYNAQGRPKGWLPGGAQFEVATSAYPQYAGLLAALQFHETQGSVEARYQQICALSRYLWEGLQEIPGVQCLSPEAPPAGLVSFTVAVGETIGHRSMMQALEAERFYLRTIAYPSCIRACCHYFTTPVEVDKLLEVLQVQLLKYLNT